MPSCLFYPESTDCCFVFYLYHHHLLGRLAELQSSLLDNARRASDTPRPTLAADTIIVPNQGVARWLKIQLAESDGIAANLDMPLPAKFIWDTLPRILPNAGDSRDFERSRLRWHLYALLPALTAQIPQVAAYMDGPNSDLLRLQLAEQLAAAFDQYLIFRPDMLDAWLAGQIEDSSTAQWQAAVWQALSKKLDKPHRGQQLRKAVEHCQNMPAGALADKLPKQVYCFGLGSLPPDYLRYLYALGRHCKVHFLLLNPCEHYWGDIAQQRITQLDSSAHIDSPLETNLSDSHPLLASLGRGTRDLLRVLYSDELLQVQEPQLGKVMDYEPPGNHSLLAKVQSGIINMQLETAENDNGADSSIQFHACHGPLREVQVLHDQLLDLLSADDALETRDIIVMVPDIAAYAPAIDGVFGAAQGRRKIDYSLSDNSRAASHPVIRSFCQLLDLPLSRWSLSEVMALAQVPAVMRKFGLDAEALEQAQDWLHAAGVRWGLDSDTRKQFEAGDFSQYSWQFGLDRLLLGLSLNDDSQLFNGIAAWTDLEGGSTAALGQMWHLLQRLRHWQQTLSQPASAAQWQDQLNQMLNDLLDDSGADEAEQTALQDLRQSFDCLSTASHCIQDEELGWMTLREVLLAELTQASARQPFLAHGVTFCGMVPLRAVPFKVVCMLGMDDGAFPRQDSHGDFNLLRQNPRLGDISVRDDDRLLFLQSIMAAQQVFYISYTGQDVASGDALAPAPIVGEWLDFLQQQHFSGLSREAFESKLIAQQPMHPFSPSLYGQSPPHPRVFSFEQAWLGDANPAQQDPGHWLDDSVRDTPQETVIELSSLKRFFDHPTRFFLRDLMQIQRELPDEDERDQEPLQLDGLQAWQLRTHMLQQVFGDELPLQPDPHLLASGLLPPPPLGESSYQQASNQLQELLSLRQQWQQARGTEAHWLDLDIALDGLRIRGRLTDLWPDGPRLLRPGNLRMKYRLRCWIDYLCYLQLHEQGCVQMAGVDLKKNQLEHVVATLPPDRAKQQLQTLLELYQKGQQQPLFFEPDLADDWLAVADKKDADAAVQKINSDLASTHHPHRLAQDPWLQPWLQKHAGVNDDFCELAQTICGPLRGALQKPGGDA